MKVGYSLLIMVILVAIGSVINAFVAILGGELSRGSLFLWYATFSYVVALSVETDRKSRKLSAPYEYGAFVFFAWPVVVPYYLFTVHRWRGLAFGLGLILFSCIPDFTSFITCLLIEE